jgi:hypothetical protein
VWQLTLWQWDTVAVAHSGSCVAVDAVAVAGGAVAAEGAAFRMAWIGRVLREIWSREWLWLDAVAVARWLGVAVAQCGSAATAARISINLR